MLAGIDNQITAFFQSFAMNYDSYVGEMKMFLQYVREGRMRHEFDVCRAKRDIAVVEAAFESHKLGHFVQLPS